MVLSKRERLIAIVTLSVLLIFVLDRFALTPFLDMNENIQREKVELITDIEHASKIFKQRKRIKKQWQNLVSNGLGNDPSVIESKVLHAIRKWSNDYGLAISSIKPDRNGRDETIIKEIIFNVACKGSMDSVARFLLELENSSLPLKIKEFQLGSREEDGRDMSLQLRLSAAYLEENGSPYGNYNYGTISEEEIR